MPIRTLLTRSDSSGTRNEKPRSLEEFGDGVLAGPIVQLGGPVSGHDHDLAVVYQEPAPRAVYLAQIALDPVARNRAAHATRHRHPKLSPMSLLPDHVTDEFPPRHFPARTINPQVIASLGEAFTSWKSLLARHRRLTASFKNAPTLNEAPACLMKALCNAL